MLYRPLGRSGLRVAPIALGTLWFADDMTWGIEEAAASNVINEALDCGVNLIDTADFYGQGLSEEYIGRAIKGRRDDVLIASKGGLPLTLGLGNGSLSRRQLRAAVDRSLRRLQTDYIDLYQVHVWDHRTPVAETLETLDSLIRQGKILYAGACNHFGWQILSALCTAHHGGWQPYVSHQVHYSLADRTAEHEVLPVALDQGLGVLVWAPLARGLLTGTHSDATDAELAAWHEPPVPDVAPIKRALTSLNDIAAETDATEARVALAWLLARPGVTSLLVGARSPAEITDAVAASDLALTPQQLTRLDDASRPAKPYPGWHQDRLRGE